MIIHHFDTQTNRFIEIEVSEEQLQKGRLGVTERRATVRDGSLQFCRELLASGASPEHVAGYAWSAGHADGSKTAHLTDLDYQVLEALEELNGDLLAELKRHAPAFVQAVIDQRKAAKHDT